MTRREEDKPHVVLTEEQLRDVDRQVAISILELSPELVNQSIPAPVTKDIRLAVTLLLDQTAGQSISIFSDKEHFWTVLINGSRYLGFADGIDSLPLAICRALLNRAGVMPHPLEIPELQDEE